jgi:hypothetical protein
VSDAVDENVVAGGDLVGSAHCDVLRHAFASALGALIEALPPGVERDIAVAETIEAHMRAVATLAHRRRLH